MIEFNNPSSATEYFSHNAIANSDIAADGDSFTICLWCYIPTGAGSKGQNIWSSQATGDDYWRIAVTDDGDSNPNRWVFTWENDTGVCDVTDIDNGKPWFIHAGINTTGTDTVFVKVAQPGDTAVTNGTDDTAVVAGAATQSAMYVGRWASGSDWHLDGAAGEFLALYASDGSAVLSDAQIVAIANGSHYFSVVDMSLATFYWPALQDTGSNQVDEIGGLTLTRTSTSGMATYDDAPMTRPYVFYSLAAPAAPAADTSFVYARHRQQLAQLLRM